MFYICFCFGRFGNFSAFRTSVRIKNRVSVHEFDFYVAVSFHKIRHRYFQISFNRAYIIGGDGKIHIRNTVVIDFRRRNADNFSESVNKGAAAVAVRDIGRGLNIINALDIICGFGNYSARKSTVLRTENKRFGIADRINRLPGFYLIAVTQGYGNRFRNIDADYSNISVHVAPDNPIHCIFLPVGKDNGRGFSAF